MQKAIRDLPLIASKKHPQWRRHQRQQVAQDTVRGEQPMKPLISNGGAMQRQPGAAQGGKRATANPKPVPVLDPKVEDRFVRQVISQLKGRPLAEKLAEYRKLAEAHAKGDGSATMLHGSGRGRGEDFFGRFREFVGNLPQKFDDFVPTSVRQAGDNLLLSGKTTGYNVDAYGVGKANDYSRYMRAGNHVIYHQYVQHPDHGEELLRRMSNLGLEIPYEMSTSATAVLWDKEWGEEPELQIDQMGDHLVGRSVQYAIAFKPRSKEEADKLVEFFERNAKHGAKQAIPHSWFVPDIRSSFKDKVDEFEKNILNIRRMGEHELMLLKKEAVKGFDPYQVWLNSELSGFIKSLALFLTLPCQIPIAVGQRMNKSFQRVKRVGNLVMPILRRAHG